MPKKTNAGVFHIELNRAGLPVAMTVRAGKHRAEFIWSDVAGQWSPFTRKGYDGPLGEMAVVADDFARSLLDIP